MVARDTRWLWKIVWALGEVAAPTMDGEQLDSGSRRNGWIPDVFENISGV